MEFFSNRTGYYYCNTTLQSYVYNLTCSYTDQKNEATMVATSMAMLFLAALFFALNLFSRFSDVSAFLKPSIRLFLSVSLSLFLPVMSYLFSEAKNHDTAAGGGGGGGGGEVTATNELPLRARTILLWMLLVEILYKKVEAIFWATADVHGYTGIVERAARIVWLGYLVFYNLRSPGKKAFYGVLWLLAATKLVQRFVTSELGKRSFAYGRNPQLLASYMTQVVVRRQREEEPRHAGQGQAATIGGGAGGSSSSALLKQCRYAVMGEEGLEKMARSKGYYRLDLKEVIPPKHGSPSSVFVTVGDVWNLSESEPVPEAKQSLLRRDPRLKRLCLSFALYKLLRRAVEGFPITPAEARDCHSLIFRGLREEEEQEDEEGTVTSPDKQAANGDALFQVLNDEVQFLCEYYHSIHPVMYASPFFLLINYIMFPVVVWASCVLMIILCSNGDVAYAFRSFRADNFPTSVGVVRMTVCLLSKANHLPSDLFSTVDLFISVLLFLTFAYEQVWEFIVFLLSNWFMVSLLASYTSKPQRRASALFRGLIRRILWVRNSLSHPNVCFKQFSVLRFCRVSPSSLPTQAVPRQAKHAIMEHLATAQHDGVALPGLSSSASRRQQQLLHYVIDEQLSAAAYGGSSTDDDGVPGLAEVILTWHIATELLASSRFPPPAPGAVAVPLSRYCAYLVAFQPGLLPDDEDVTEHVYGKMKDELKKELGCWRYYLARQGTRCQKLRETAAASTATTTTLRRGARLGQVLIQKASSEEEGPSRMWKLLDDVWTEILVYAAPASSELHVKAHKEALAQGGEFITMLWALATHTGIFRRASTVPTTSPASTAV